jgi:AcrR family transcriptional regulator
MPMNMSTPRPEPSRRLSASDWIKAAMEAIVEDGVAAVAVESLAARLGATKGSFYHHFRNRDALIIAALEDWERQQTDAVIARMALIPEPRERLRAIMAAALADRAGAARDAALAASATHPLVKPVVARVTERRLSYMTQVCAEIGMPPDQARRRVLLLYSSYLGLFNYLRVRLGERLDDVELSAYTRELLDALVPAPSVATTPEGREARRPESRPSLKTRSIGLSRSTQ